MKKFLEFYLNVLYWFFFFWITVGTLFIFVFYDASFLKKIFEFLFIIILFILSINQTGNLVRKENAKIIDYILAFFPFLIILFIIFILS